MNIHDRVQRAMDRPGENHRDPWFAPFFTQILDDSKLIYNTTEGTPFIFPGTGTGGWEAALANTLSPGDKVVTFRYGQFSHLWIDMMERLGLDVQVIECEWGTLHSAHKAMCVPLVLHLSVTCVAIAGEGANEAKLAEVLKADSGKTIKAVAVVHNETTTGVTSDIAQVHLGACTEICAPKPNL